MATDDPPQDMWTTSTLKQFFTTLVTNLRDDTHVRFTDLDARYQEKFAGSDLRYQQRFDASEKALQSASLAAEKAVQAALAAAKEAVQAASISAEKAGQAGLASAEKAIQKAEQAQLAHNHSQNEWRATVNDITKVVAERARHEAEALVKSLSDRMEITFRSLSDKTDAAVSALAKSEGRTAGISSATTLVIAVVATLASIAGITIGLISHSSAPSPYPIVQIPSPVTISPK